jgi:hypothetical protein
MTISFDDDVVNGATTVGHDGDDSLGSFEGSEASGRDSRVSASEFDGDIKTERLDRILFGDAECRRQVTSYRNDAAELVRICGNKFRTCAHGHMGVVRFGEGIYKTLAGKGNRFIDGMGGTCISKEKYDDFLGQEAADRGRSIAEAGVTLGLRAGLEESIKPSSSEESEYQMGYGKLIGPSLAKGRLKHPPKTETPNKPPTARFPTPAAKAKGPSIGAGALQAGLGPNVVAELQKTAQNGARGPKKAATKLEKVEVKTESAVDPMSMAVQQLATTLGNLDMQMKQMNSSIVELQGQTNKEFGKTKEATKSGGTFSDKLGGPYYAVAHGRAGHQGIYQSWSECAVWVTGVPGNVFQKVETLDTAHEFIEQYNVGQIGHQKEGQGGTLFREGPGRNEERHPGVNNRQEGQRAFSNYLGEARTNPHS